MEARNRSLNDWFTRIRTHQLVLPRFQRFEAWTHRNISGLLDTVLKELPAGALLILEIGDEEPFVSRSMSGAPDKGERIVEHLLDGQQRLTALWRSLMDDYSDRTYFIQLSSDDNNEDEFAGPPRAISVARWIRNGKRYPLWINEPTEVWNRGLIPATLMRPDPNGEEDFKRWARTATQGDPENLISLITKGTNLRTKFANFNLPFLSLPNSTPKEIALDVFVKMNTSAQPLSTYDIVVAQVEAGTGFSLHELVDELRKEAPTLDLFSEPSQVILNAGALLQDRESSKTVMLGKHFAEGLIDNWNLLAIGAQKAARFLEEEHVFDSARLPSDPVVPMLVALWAHAPDGLDAEGEARTILRKFMWRAFLTERYEYATNSRTFADYKLLTALVQGKANGQPPIFDEANFPLPQIEDIASASWPKKRDRLGRAILLLCLRSGGLDLADGSPATRENLRTREYHHIFPVNILEKYGKETNEIYRALNCALVTWKTNRNISAKSPIEYLKQRIDANSLGEEEIRRRLLSHEIEYDTLVQGDYEAFLIARAARLLPVIRHLCG